MAWQGSSENASRLAVMSDFPNLPTCSKKVTREELKPEDQDGSQKEVSIGRP